MGFTEIWKCCKLSQNIISFGVKMESKGVKMESKPVSNGVRNLGGNGFGFGLKLGSEKNVIGRKVMDRFRR